MISAYQLLAYWLIFFCIGIGCIVTDGADSEFRISIPVYHCCIVYYPLSLPWYENGQDMVVSLRLFQYHCNGTLIPLVEVY